jgi:hypothetical protein
MQGYARSTSHHKACFSNRSPLLAGQTRLSGEILPSTEDHLPSPVCKTDLHRKWQPGQLVKHLAYPACCVILVSLAVVLGLVEIVANRTLVQNLIHARIILPLGFNDVVGGRAILDSSHQSQYNIVTRIPVLRGAVSASAGRY